MVCVLLSVLLVNNTLLLPLYSPPLGPGVEDFKIKEDVRIAGIIQLINKDVEIVPRKLYYRDAAMKIQKNADFKGKFYQTIAIVFY